jgi:uncharacterized protein (DUF1778 family)
MAKKSENRQRQKIIAVRVTETEWEIIDQKAENVGLCLSSFMRTVVLGSADKTMARRVSTDKVALARILTALGQLGADFRHLVALSEMNALEGSKNGLKEIGQHIHALRYDLVRALGLRE